MELQTLEISAESNMFYGFNFKNFNIMNYAKIAKNKSLLKEYDNRTVYLKDGDEFQIQLFNPEIEEIAARITIDGIQLSNDIVIRPGERIWLERYTDKPKKFKFETYEVESDNKDVDNAIRNNGVIKVTFHKRQKRSVYWYNTSPDITYTYYNSVSNYTTDYLSINSIESPIQASISYPASYTTAASTTPIKKELKKETGRVTEGDNSNQSFMTIDMEFNPYPYLTEVIKILPESQKPFTKEDTQRVYCSNCGRKLKTKYKYCPSCGTKIE